MGEEFRQIPGQKSLPAEVPAGGEIMNSESSNPLMNPQTILYPTDYGPTSQAALSSAVELAQQYGSRLIVLHVVETLGPEMVSYGEAEFRPQPESFRKSLWQELHQKVSTIPREIPVEYVLSDGDPTTTILEATDRYHCDFIVMGSHGRTGLNRLLIGSVAEKVVRLAPCPVLVVKPPPKAPRPKAAPKGTDLHPHFLDEKSS
jgi:nucleotide-binding universal stress UspA family protein